MQLTKQEKTLLIEILEYWWEDSDDGADLNDASRNITKSLLRKAKNDR